MQDFCEVRVVSIAFGVLAPWKSPKDLSRSISYLFGLVSLQCGAAKSVYITPICLGL